MRAIDIPSGHGGLIDAMPVPMVVTAGPESVIAYMNPAFCEMVGAPEGGLAAVGTPVAAWILPQDLEKATRNIGIVMAGGEPTDDPRYRIWSYDRSRVIDVEIHSVVSRLGDEPIMLSTFVDASRRAQVERELRRTQADLLEAQDVARIGSYVFDITVDHWTSSRVLDEIFGIDGAYERTASGWLGLVHPDDAADMATYLTGDVLERGEPFDRQYRVVRRGDGETRWVHGRGRLRFDDDGHPTALVGTIQDVTEQRQAADELRESQERLQAILDNAPMLVYVLDLDGRFTLVNRAANDLLAPGTDIIGKVREDFMPREIAAAHRANDVEVITHGAPISFEETNLEPDGEHVYLSTKFPVFDLQGAIAGVCGISVDITQRTRAEEENLAYRDGLEGLVRERTAELEEASRAKSSFMASMSHELRTPLNSIIGFTGIMLQGLAGELNAEQRAQLTMVNHSGRQLLALVNDVLDLERIEAGAVTLDRSRIDVRHLVRTLEQTIRPMAEDVGLTLEIEDAGAPETIDTDRRKLEQILLNLLSNAIKYTPQGNVTFIAGKRPDGSPTFTVRDTGVGIAAEDHGRVFEQFSQLMPKAGAKYPGSGLGLAISRQLATMLGGRIELDSSPGAGSAFTLILPPQ